MILALAVVYYGGAAYGAGSIMGGIVKRYKMRKKRALQTEQSIEEYLTSIQLTFDNPIELLGNDMDELRIGSLTFAATYELDEETGEIIAVSLRNRMNRNEYSSTKEKLRKAISDGIWDNYKITMGSGYGSGAKILFERRENNEEVH